MYVTPLVEDGDQLKYIFDWLTAVALSRPENSAGELIPVDAGGLKLGHPESNSVNNDCAKNSTILLSRIFLIFTVRPTYR